MAFLKSKSPVDLSQKRSRIFVFMVTKKTWQEFRDTGLFMFINTILHAFGWALVVEVDESGSIKECYPARVTFRGFEGEDQTEMYKKIGTYLKDNAAQLKKEAHDD